MKLYGGYTKSGILDEDAEGFEFEDVMLYKEHIRFDEEPTNQYDPNAIKVYLTLIEDEEHHFGYVPKNMTTQVKKTLATKYVRRMSGKVVGGKVKQVVGFDEVRGKDGLSLGIEISIYYIPDVLE